MWLSAPRIALAFAVSATALLSPSLGQDETDPADSDGPGGWIDFGRDVRPILKSRCLECHGPEEAKNDFRVDDEETMLAYLEPGDLESSSLWADYLITDDMDMRMPPPGPDGAADLTGAELATIKLWIEEGAHWSEPEEPLTEEASPEQAAPPQSTVAKIWSFQGLFHPASVHFPIALLAVSAAFVCLSFFNRESFEPAAFHCLWIGALGAIAACAMGWAYAQHEGYGGGFSFNLADSSIDRHRWLGIVVAVVATMLIPVARSVRREGKTGMRLLWCLGSLLLLGAVSTTGYQGGELTYGEDHYAEEFQRLFSSADSETASEAEPTETSEDGATPEEGTDPES